MSSLIFFEKKKKINMFSAAALIGTLGVKINVNNFGNCSDICTPKQTVFAKLNKEKTIVDRF